ncbi:MAG: EAL domain-containing protein [Clostridia bacterium]|nr:EAL domain-containing protein [Clostridia bacterium]
MNEGSVTLLVDLIEIGICVLAGFIIYFLLDRKNRRQSNIVKKQAYTDQLTGRGNRYLFLSILDKLIAKKKKFAVCFMDLDGFKHINDSMGHDAGDELLIALANTFDEKLPSNATAYRLGGDEFAIVVEGVKTTEDITHLLDELKNTFKTPFIIENTSISLEYSLGIAIYPEDADNRQDLIMYADDAMYYIKEHGKNDYYFHNKALKAKMENQTKTQMALKEAYANDQFGISLQPRIDVKETDKICFEALLYWNHPTLGKLPSSYFIKQADDMALTIKLDNYVLERVCKGIKMLREKGITDGKIAVNISNKHATKKDFVNKLCDILKEYDIQPGVVQIEITDTIELDKIEDYKIMFEKLKEHGAEIIVNNFEIKYEAIKLFSGLSIDEIKLSADYLDENTNINPKILVDVIKLCKELNYKVVINSIDNEMKLNSAIRNGADKIQGDFLFKKMDLDLVSDFVSEYSSFIYKINNIILTAKNTKK